MGRNRDIQVSYPGTYIVYLDTSVYLHIVPISGNACKWGYVCTYLYVYMFYIDTYARTTKVYMCIYAYAYARININIDIYI